MNGLIAAGSAASTICQQVCQQVTDNGRTNEVESTENKANKKHALIALVPGSLTGLAAYSAITSGVLASIPTSLLTFFLASPIGWSIGVGTLICGLNFFLFFVLKASDGKGYITVGEDSIYKQRGFEDD